MCRQVWCENVQNELCDRRFRKKIHDFQEDEMELHIENLGGQIMNAKKNVDVFIISIMNKNS